MKYLLLVLVVILLAGCSSAVDTTQLQKDIKANGDALKAAQTALQQLTAKNTALEGQMSQLQKQLAASDNRSSQYATRDDLNKALAASTASVAQMDIMKRLAACEASELMLKSRMETFEAMVRQSLLSNQTRIDQAINSLGSTSPAMAEIIMLKVQIADLQNRLTSHGW